MAAKGVQLKFDVSMTVYEKGRKAPQYTLESDINGDVSFADFVKNHKDLLLSIALETLKDEQSRGFTKNPVVVTDNKTKKPITDVNPFGKIEFLAPAVFSKVLSEIFEGIMFRSKRVTGQYIESHRVVYNNKQVASTRAEFEAWLKTNPSMNEGDQVMFVNVAPYARRLERLGVTAQRTPTPDKARKVKSRDKLLRSADSKGKILAPNGVYYLTEKAAKRKYKHNVRISLQMVLGSRLGLSGSFKTHRGSGKGAPRGKEKRNPRSYLYPAIIVKFSSERGTV